MIHPGMIAPPAKVVIWALALFALGSSLSFAAVLLLLLQLPVDAFAEAAPDWSASIPRRILRIGRNILGWVIVLSGLVLSIPGVPGQGLLMIAFGFLLVDFPGKHRILHDYLMRPSLRSYIDRLRVRFGRPPFIW